MKFILGTKEGMTQVFDETGRVFPATAIKAGPLTVTQVKGVDTDGYTAVQVGLTEQKESRLNKALLGHFKKAGVTPQKVLREFRVESTDLKVGDTITANTFEKGDVVTVRGISKGKGFQGGVKKHGFHGGPRTHGQKHNERTIGSIGGGGRAGWRVVKGKKMPGRMGSDMVSVRNLMIVGVDEATNTILVKGAVPGRPGTVIEIVSK